MPCLKLELARGEKMRLIIFGPPGAGKGTYASMLSSMFKIATGDIFREEIRKGTELGRISEPFVSVGKLVPDEIVIGLLRRELNKSGSKRGFILDGYPRTIDQAIALEKMAKIDAIILLIVPEWIIIERLSNRRICRRCGAIYNLKYLKPKREGICDKCGGELYQRKDDKPEVIKKRLKVYEEQTRPLIEFYKSRVPFINIECGSVNVPPKVVVEKIVQKLEELGLLRRKP